MNHAAEDARQDALLLFLQEGVLTPNRSEVFARAKAQERAAVQREMRDRSAAGDLYNLVHPDAPGPVNEYDIARRESWSDVNERRKNDRAYKDAVNARKRQRRAEARKPRPVSLTGVAYVTAEREKRKARRVRLLES